MRNNKFLKYIFQISLGSLSLSPTHCCKLFSSMLISWQVQLGCATHLQVQPMMNSTTTDILFKFQLYIFFYIFQEVAQAKAKDSFTRISQINHLGSFIHIFTDSFAFFPAGASSLSPWLSWVRISPRCTTLRLP